MSLHGTPFQLGNTIGRGRPKGSRNKVTLPAQRLLDQHAEALMSKCIASALRGDMKAMALCIRYLLSPDRLRASRLKLPPIKTVDDIATAQDVILTAVANNKLSAADGQALGSILETRRKVIEDRDIAARVLELERRLKESESCPLDPVLEVGS